MSDNIFKGMIKEYKKVVQIPFEEYKEKTKKDKKEVFQFMVHKMANDDIKLFESLETSYKYIEMIEEELEKYKAIIKEVRNQLDYLETYSSKEDVFEDMKRRLDRIDKIIGSDKE